MINAAGGTGPDEQAGFGLGQRPAAAGFGPVMVPAQRAQIAWCRRSAVLMGNGVVQVATVRGLAATGKATSSVPGPHREVGQPAGPVGH